MVLKSWNDWQEDYGGAVGNGYVGARNYVDAITKKGGEMICNLHNKHPDKWFIPPITRGFLTAVCGGAGLATPSISGFGGGQCPANYYIIGKWEVTRRFQQGTFPVEETLIGNPGIPGAITKITTNAADGANVMDFEIFTSYSDNPRLVRIDQSSGVGYVLGTVSYEFIRADGQPDVCDNQGGYPDSGDVDNRDINNSVSVDITNNNGDTITTQQIDISVNNEGDSFSFPTTLSMGGISVSVDFDGFSVGGSGESGSNGEDGGGGGSTTTVYKKPFDANDFVTIPKPIPDPEPEPGEEEELEEEEIENPEIVWVLVDIVKTPDYGKTILQNTEENNDYFAGYFHWTIATEAGTYRLPAIPIRKLKNAFKAPSDALGYALYTVNNAKVSTKLYKQIIEEEV